MAYAAPAMSLTDWFRRHRWLFKPAPEVDAPGDQEMLREEYGEEAVEQAQPPAFMGGTAPTAGFVGLETEEAAEDATESDEPPPDRAP